MKPGRVFWGVFFAALGLLLLATRFGFFSFVWSDLWRFWPLVLILIGGALLLKGSRYSMLMLGLGGAVLAVLLVSVLSFSWLDGNWDEARESREQTFTIAHDPGVSHASLVFQGGAGTFGIQGGGQALFDATTHSSIGEYSFSVDSTGEGREIRLAFNGSHHGWNLGRFDNEAHITLHPEPAWDLDLGLGAARLDLDLSTLVVERLRLKNGASTTKVRLGDRGKDTRVDIEAGASTIRVEVPESAGCELQVEGALTSRRFPGFEKMDDGEYRTENYSTAERKISIAVHAGVSSIRVTRY